ncbi:MAG: polysaccharide lyase family 7 protein [Bacteroidales bacterium]|nr:polysaccharide lyase family 7 protein [Bacteroidales bacterium]MCF8389558.1 polysaccharide lyase family 7 protein [Bacteroidales bacterium]
MNLRIREIASLLIMSYLCTTVVSTQNLNFDLASTKQTKVTDTLADLGYPEINTLESNNVFDPYFWKITFPLENPETGNALEVLNPEFSSYVLGEEAWPAELAEYFYTTDEGQAFYCKFMGATTPNTDYARTELREMVGPDQHNWTLQTGGHLYGRVKITDFEENANKLFFMQIHGKLPSDKPLLKCIWEKGVIRLITKSGERLVDYKKGDNGKYVEVGEEWFTCNIDVDTAAMIVKINGQIIEVFDREEVLQYWPSNNTYYFKAGNYLQHDNEGAAAKVIYSGLEVSHENNPGEPGDPTNSIFRITECDSYTVPSGDETYQSSGIYMDTIPNYFGADSIMIIMVNINNSNTGTDIQTACGEYSWIDGNTYTTSNSTATHVLTNADGCDSLVTLMLTTNTVNTSVIQEGALLTANEAGATYQWLDCSGNVPISGATNQSFTPSTNGDYSVIVTNNECSDTSSCYTVQGVGISENNFGNKLQLYANPTNGKFSIDLGDNYQRVTITLKDLTGRLIQHNTYKDSQLLNIEIQEPAGIYLLIVESVDKKTVFSLVKE